MSARKTPVLERTTFRTSRLLDFASEKELVAQTGHRREAWPLVILKELVDNGVDACEEAGIAPAITVTVDQSGITVADNGPGIPAETDRGHPRLHRPGQSSREAYVSPTRGAQGNALKTIVAMPFVLDGERGRDRDRGPRRPAPDRHSRRPHPPGAGDPPRAGRVCGVKIGTVGCMVRRGRIQHRLNPRS